MSTCIRHIQCILSYPFAHKHTVTTRRHLHDELKALGAPLSEHALWHGTPKLENVYSILSTGFKVRVLGY